MAMDYEQIDKGKLRKFVTPTQKKLNKTWRNRKIRYSKGPHLKFYGWVV